MGGVGSNQYGSKPGGIGRVPASGGRPAFYGTSRQAARIAKKRSGKSKTKTFRMVPGSKMTKARHWFPGAARGHGTAIT